MNFKHWVDGIELHLRPDKRDALYDLPLKIILEWWNKGYTAKYAATKFKKYLLSRTAP